MSGKFEQRTDARANALAPRIWEPRFQEEFPTSGGTSASLPCVKLILQGLMGFSPYQPNAGDPTYCHVGFHGGDDNHPHRVTVYAFDHSESGATCNRRLLSENLESPDLAIDVIDPDTSILQGAAFYQPTEPVNDRKDLSDARDFRWIVDFESEYLYGRSLEKIEDFYYPKLTITNGLFYTLRRTGSTFRVQTPEGGHVSELGNIAHILAANIYLKPTGRVNLTVNGEKLSLEAPAEIYIYNECEVDNKPCVFYPYDVLHKERRNDFYLNYDAFETDDDEEYELFLVQQNKPRDDEGDHVCQRRHPFLTDEAPCAGSGYGAGGGLP